VGSESIALVVYRCSSCLVLVRAGTVITYDSLSSLLLSTSVIEDFYPGVPKRLLEEIPAALTAAEAGLAGRESLVQSPRAF
jgi:hypothetical protein